MSERPILSLNRPVALPGRLAAHLRRPREDARQPAPDMPPQPAPAMRRQRAERRDDGDAAARHAATAERIAHNQHAERAFLERRAKDEAERAEHRRIAELLAELCPAVFGYPPAPLAIGVHHDLAALLAGEADPRALAVFLARWTHHKPYLRALAAGETRRDLNGQPTEAPTAEHRHIAAEALSRQERRERAREALHVRRR